MSRLNQWAIMAGTVGLLCLASAGASAGTQAEDQTLVQGLQNEQRIQSGLPGLDPDDIRTMRKILNEQEAARQNPTPPKVTNKITMLERGASPQITIMERFDSTLVFADRNGTPLELTAWRINDKHAANLIPIYSDVEGSEASGLIRPASTGDAQAAGQADDKKGPAKALIVSPQAAMRSTNITVMLRGESYPLVLTVSTRSTLDTQQDIAYIQELRLSWVSTMPKAQALAGRFTGASGDTALDSDLLSLVQGVPAGDLENVKLEGSLAEQVSLWRDATSDEPVWYLRMGDHIEPMNVAIADRTRDGLRGFTVMRLQGVPPKVIGLTANGQYSTLTVTGT